MGETRVEIEIIAKKKKTVSVLIDTGATLTVLPKDMLTSSGVKKIKIVEVELADGRIIKRQLGEAKIKLNGNVVTTRVIFGEKTDTSVLGTVVLEELGLAVDPVRKRLIPVRYLLI